MISPAQPNPSSNPTPAELQLIVARLQDFLATYLKEGRHLGIQMSPKQLLAVVDQALLQMETGQRSGPADQTAEAFFWDGCCEALLQEQQGLYEKTKDAEGHENYAPVGDAVWIVCLKALRDATVKLAK